MTKQCPSDFWPTELLAVTRRDLNQKPLKCFDVAIEAVHNKNQLLLIVNGTAGTSSNTLYVEFQLDLVVKM